MGSQLNIYWLRPASWILLLSLAILTYAFWRLFVSLWLEPLRAKRLFEAQGLHGMPYRLLVGSSREVGALFAQAHNSPMTQVSHDVARRVLPHYYAWTEKFGKPCFYWFGPRPTIFVTEPELAREILSNKFGHYRKRPFGPIATDLLGEGLVFLEGEKWAQHRRIVSPAFYIEKLKAMIPTMAACTTSLLDDWAAQIAKEASGRKEFDVHVEFQNLTADIIARTAFGSSYAEGKQVFQIQREQTILFGKLISKINLPGSRFVPTRINRHCWELKRQLHGLLRQMINKRMEAIEQGETVNDLLGLMMEANRNELQGNPNNLSMSIDEIVDECKTFFVAGHETSSSLFTWALLLLGSSPEWQERAREEVVRVCGEEPPTAESLNNLKTVHMITLEALRLYPPLAVLFRETGKKMKLGKDLVLPQGTMTIIPIVAFHHDLVHWGNDADCFNPQRFAEGVAQASENPASFMPFSLGPRYCLGQNFALSQAKVAIALIVQRFAFHLSPSYLHAPISSLTLRPQFGVQIVFEMLPLVHCHSI